MEDIDVTSDELIMPRCISIRHNDCCVNDENKTKVENVEKNVNQANLETNKNQLNPWKQKRITEEEDSVICYEQDIYSDDANENKMNCENATKQGIYVFLSLLLLIWESYNEFITIKTNECSRGD